MNSTDETQGAGYDFLICFEEFAVLVKTAPFIGVTGKVQAESGVVHVVADELWKPKLAHEPTKVRSRDFH